VDDIQERAETGRRLIVQGILEDDLAPPAPPGPLARRLLIPFPDGLARSVVD